MHKVFFIIAIFFLLSNCGYEPIYSSKNINFNIGNIEKVNNSLNNEFVRLIKSVSNKKTNNTVDIKIDSKKIITIKSKDSKGNPLIYELKINLEITKQNESKAENHLLSRKISYKNTDDKFELKKYESELQKILVNKLVEDLIKYLTNNQWL